VFHDLQHVRHPEFFRRVDLPFWQFALRLAELASTHVIAVSQATAQDVRDHYRRAPQAITVIPHGVDPVFFGMPTAAPEPYLLCVSTLHPHKNIERLLRAFSLAKLHQRLICAGMFGFEANRLLAMREELGLTGSVEFTGWIPREELLRLYERAHAIVYPSTFEGFGMPVLEGMASGIPTACSSIPVLRETGGDAVLYFDPYDEHAIIEALQRISNDTDLRARLSAAGRARARQYTWARTGRETLRVLEQVGGRARTPTGS
jgi:glycosyltransferase involved in cell wall biosynthesis